MLDADAVGRLRIRGDGYRQLASRQIYGIGIDDSGRRCDQQRNTIFCVGYGPIKRTKSRCIVDWCYVDHLGRRNARAAVSVGHLHSYDAGGCGILGNITVNHVAEDLARDVGGGARIERYHECRGSDATREGAYNSGVVEHLIAGVGCH